MGQIMCAEEQKKTINKKTTKTIQPDELSEDQIKQKRYVEQHHGGDITIYLYDIQNYEKKPLKIKYFKNNFNKGLLLRQVQIIYPNSYVYYFDDKNTFKNLNQETQKNQNAYTYDILCNRDFQQLGISLVCLYVYDKEIKAEENQEELKKFQECRDYIKSKL
ncbi:hypothetical protein ABPG73_020313 [Tetrahymena malaccensis]